MRLGVLQSPSSPDTTLFSKGINTKWRRETLSLQDTRKTIDWKTENILIIVGLFLKKATAGLFWVMCKSEILIQYSLCEQVYNLKAELGKTQSKDTYKLQKTM